MTNKYEATPTWLSLGLFDGWFKPCLLDNEKTNWSALTVDFPAKTFIDLLNIDGADSWIEKAIGENQRGKTIALLVRLNSHAETRLKEVGAHFLPSSNKEIALVILFNSNSFAETQELKPKISIEQKLFNMVKDSTADLRKELKSTFGGLFQ